MTTSLAVLAGHSAEQKYSSMLCLLLLLPLWTVQGGWNVCALAAVLLGVLPCLPGLLASVGVPLTIEPLFSTIYDFAWFVGVGVSSFVYYGLMRLTEGSQPMAAAAGGT
jgi:NCS1 family nucleobase:cation symporter-1